MKKKTAFLFSALKRGVDEKEKKDRADGVAVQEEREEELSDSLELVAVISAAIAASTGRPTESFVVRSIRRRSCRKH